jgi:hypothetical protein
MQMRLKILALPVLSVALGCNPQKAQPIDPQTSADQAATRAADVIRQAGSGLGFVTDQGGVLDKMLGGADDATAGIMRKAVPPPMPTPIIRHLRGTPLVKTMGGVEALGSFLTADEQFDETAHDIQVLLHDRLLVASNIESKTDTEVTYLLKPEPTCQPISTDPAAMEDPSCGPDLLKLQVRLVVVGDGDGVRITVLVGPQRDELSAFIIHSDLLAWEADFAKGLRAVTFINDTLKPNDPQKPYPFSKLEGRIRLSLQKLGPQHVKGAVAILEAVNVEADQPDSGPISVHIAPSDPLFAVTGDGVAKQATFDYDLAQTDVTTSWDPQHVGMKNSDLHISVGGLYGEATLTEGQKQVVFHGTGIGQTFVAVRGSHIFDLDFNPAAGRKFDLTVQADGDQPRFEVTPAFDLSLAFNLGAVAGDFKDPPASYLTHETYRIVFDGATPAVIEPVKANDAVMFAGGLKVVAGTLVLSTNGTPPTTVTVPAGKCLTGKTDAPPMSHPLLGKLDAVACP